MGGICPCFGKQPEYTYAPVPSSNPERTPLLASGSYGATNPRTPIAKNGGEATTARLHSISKSDQPDKPFGASDLRQVYVLDVGVPNLDKQFKDHAALFNEYLEKYNQLKDIIGEMMASYDDTGVTPGTLAQVFSMLKGELSDEALESMKIKRKYKFCMELNFEAKLMNGICIGILDNFNKANRLVKDLVDKGPTLVQTVIMVLDNEGQAKRDVTVYYSEPERTEQGPDKLKACLGNIGEMKRVKPAVGFITKEANSMFDALKDAAHELFKSAEA